MLTHRTAAPSFCRSTGRLSIFENGLGMQRFGSYEPKAENPTVLPAQFLDASCHSTASALSCFYLR